MISFSIYGRNRIKKKLPVNTTCTTQSDDELRNACTCSNNTGSRLLAPCDQFYFTTHIKINKIPWEKSVHSQLLVIACFANELIMVPRSEEWNVSELNWYRLVSIKKTPPGTLHMQCTGSLQSFWKSSTKFCESFWSFSFPKPDLRSASIISYCIDASWNC